MRGVECFEPVGDFDGGLTFDLTADVGNGDFTADGGVADQANQVVLAFDGGAVELDDDVRGFQSGDAGGTVGWVDTGDPGAADAAKSEPRLTFSHRASLRKK